MSKSQTVLQVTFVDGKSKVLEYGGDDLAGITKLLDKEKKEMVAVRMKTLDSSGKIVFDKSFSYVPAEEVGKVVKAE